ncbi:Transcriptional regulator AcuR [Candidatus Magnetaquicoccaceae bacterium FCR-1]|uniref:Transcriptional regulator AcuR n=1 Tax=Candidatus Magnetaquiglobus chichijimensis TaxID=3141448 RepID=A0ABQ0CA30_9PROT
MGRTSDAKERLIQSGMELLHAGGYARAGVQEICTRAGVRKGSFYHFFASKSALGLAVLERLHDESSRLLAEALAPDLPPEGRIARLFDRAAEIQELFLTETGAVRGCPLGNLTLEMSNEDETFRLYLTRVLRETIHHIEKVIAPREESTIMAEAILSLLEGAILLAKAENDPAVIRRMGEMAARILMATCSSTSPPP